MFYAMKNERKRGGVKEAGHLKGRKGLFQQRESEVVKQGFLRLAHLIRSIGWRKFVLTELPADTRLIRIPS